MSLFIRNSGVFTAFTFSEELGFGEGGHVLELNLYLVTSGRLVTPQPFLWWIDIQVTLSIVIYTDLGIFAELWFFFGFC